MVETFEDVQVRLVGRGDDRSRIRICREAPQSRRKTQSRSASLWTVRHLPLEESSEPPDFFGHHTELPSTSLPRFSFFTLRPPFVVVVVVFSVVSFSLARVLLSLSPITHLSFFVISVCWIVWIVGCRCLCVLLSSVFGSLRDGWFGWSGGGRVLCCEGGGVSCRVGPQITQTAVNTHRHTSTQRSLNIQHARHHHQRTQRDTHQLKMIPQNDQNQNQG